MARQVFFDPFGSYTRGFDTGAQRQMGLEDSVRRARAQDYDFNVLQPYRTAAVQREDQFDTKALPYRIGMLPIGYHNAQTGMYGQDLNLAERGAQIFGVPQPLTDVARRAFGLQFGTTNTGNGDINTTIYGRGTDGQLYPIAQHPNYGQQVLDSANFERNLQLQQLHNQGMYYSGMTDYRMQEAMARQIAAQAAMLRAQGVDASGGYAPSGMGFAGFGGGVGAGAYPGYDSMLDYNLPNQ